jgi:hypothetical protein
MGEEGRYCALSWDQSFEEFSSGLTVMPYANSSSKASSECSARTRVTGLWRITSTCLPGTSPSARSLARACLGISSRAMIRAREPGDRSRRVKPCGRLPCLPNDLPRPKGLRCLLGRRPPKGLPRPDGKPGWFDLPRPGDHPRPVDRPRPKNLRHQIRLGLRFLML